ncbi:hypothetical protein B7494_g3045 [Chlorociboria aeruginascens]|nr:hypothetical protein B7494_g3045 [Chlorociboria aeruginascens]
MHINFSVKQLTRRDPRREVLSKSHDRPRMPILASSVHALLYFQFDDQSDRVDSSADAARKVLWQPNNCQPPPIQDGLWGLGEVLPIPASYPDADGDADARHICPARSLITWYGVILQQFAPEHIIGHDALAPGEMDGIPASGDEITIATVKGTYSSIASPQDWLGRTVWVVLGLELGCCTRPLLPLFLPIKLRSEDSFNQSNASRTESTAKVSLESIFHRPAFEILIRPNDTHSQCLNRRPNGTNLVLMSKSDVVHCILVLPTCDSDPPPAPPNPSSPPPASKYHNFNSALTRNYTGMEATHNLRPAPYTNSHSHDISMAAPKSIAFELLFPESPQYRARLPMRVQIFPHDTTDSIITTVKNFYGLYAGPTGAKGVSFEDEQGITLIARYENLRNNMVVYVRVIDEPAPSTTAYGPSPYHSVSPILPQTSYPGDGQMAPPQPSQALNYGQPLSRPTSRTSRKRSISPNSGRGRRSASASTNPPPPMKTGRSRSDLKSRGSSAHGSFADIHSDGMNGYSSGDGASGSVSSKAKSEHLGNTEISLDNIVEGGRRKRAKFESSELPLFAPPQMPAATSNSSVSPARRIEHQRASFPFTHPSQNPFSNPQPLQSPQSFGSGLGRSGIFTTPAPQGRRTRGARPAQHSMATTPGNSSGILPTPDPTVGSCMSEEDKDVALQLMRLGEISNISHGRTSTSTLDDTFSGRADAASSTGATSDGESESGNDLPSARRQKREISPSQPSDALKKVRAHLKDILPSHDSTEPSGDEVDYEEADGTFRPGDELLDMVDQAQPKMSKSKSAHPAMGKPRASTFGAKVNKTRVKSRPANGIKSKKSASISGSKGPMSPTSLPAQSRKTSIASTPGLNFQHQLNDDEEDLSSKPRCQRCRKSKKGCDRQRPCQRCKDAGLSADQCVSEDEGNGRKGRYGRHMGVPVKVKKDDVHAQNSSYSSAIAASVQVDRSKKRKR